jgi:NTP pyrophosphatase (non-canonical NTP hydrolase)
MKAHEFLKEEARYLLDQTTASCTCSLCENKRQRGSKLLIAANAMCPETEMPDMVVFSTLGAQVGVTFADKTETANLKSPAPFDRGGPLQFEILRRVNVTRQREKFQPCDKWNLSAWGNALAGEVGELCNRIKKLEIAEELAINEDLPGIRRESVQEIAKELADVVIYADLLAARLGIDLGEAVRQKFNEVSDRVGSQIKL